MVIVVDQHGHMSIDTTGPIKGQAGALALLDEARKLVEQMSGYRDE